MKKFVVVREQRGVPPVRIFTPVFKDLLPESEAKLWAWLRYDVINCESRCFVYVEQNPFKTGFFKESDDE